MYLILVLAMGCFEATERPQSKPVTTPSVSVAGQVDLTLNFEGPQPVSRDRLRQLWPEFISLDETQLRAMSSVLNTVPTPCSSCGDLPFAHCVDRRATNNCGAIRKLVGRAERMAIAGDPVADIKAAINYPDTWHSEANLVTAPNVDIYRDKAGPFNEATQASIDELRTRYGPSLEVREYDITTDPSASLGVRSRPTWFINGHRFRGAQSLNALTRFIDLELADQGT